jgi:hypothetical protein
LRDIVVVSWLVHVVTVYKLGRSLDSLEIPLYVSLLNTEIIALILWTSVNTNATSRIGQLVIIGNSVGMEILTRNATKSLILILLSDALHNVAMSWRQPALSSTACILHVF